MYHTDTISQIFRNKTGIELLSDMIKMQDSGERLFIDERRCHRNDGLIFTLGMTRSYDGRE